jgi:hypothetical protein
MLDTSKVSPITRKRKFEMSYVIPGFEIDPNARNGSAQIPVGMHELEIVGHEMSANKNSNGGGFVFKLKICDGENAGLIGQNKFNLVHDNPKVVEIAKNQLSCVFIACGVTSGAPDPEFVMGRRFKAYFEHQKDKPELTNMRTVYFLDGREVGGGASAAVSKPAQLHPVSQNQTGFTPPVQQPQQFAQPVQQPQQFAQPVQQPQQFAQPVQQPQQFAQPSVQPQQFAQPPVQPQQFAQPVQQPQQFAQPPVQPQQFAQPPWLTPTS